MRVKHGCMCVKVHERDRGIACAVPLPAGTSPTSSTVMVRIIDGEIVQDDDPRLRQRAAPAPAAPPATVRGLAGPPRQPPAGGTAGGALFDWSAPPFRLVPNPDAPGTPDVQIFGRQLPLLGLLGLGALGMIFGWRGLLFGGLIGYLYLNSQRQQQQQQGQGRQPAHGGAGGISGFMMQQAQGLTGSAAAAGSRPGQGQSGGAHGNSSSGSAFQGRSYKLGSSS